MDKQKTGCLCLNSSSQSLYIFKDQVLIQVNSNQINKSKGKKKYFTGKIPVRMWRNVSCYIKLFTYTVKSQYMTLQIQSFPSGSTVSTIIILHHSEKEHAKTQPRVIAVLLCKLLVVVLTGFGRLGCRRWRIRLSCLFL